MSEKNRTGALGALASRARKRITEQKPEDRELIRMWNKTADVPNSYQRRPRIDDEEFERMQRGEVLYPLVAYHGTPHLFQEFARGDVGFHIGTKEQALKRVEDLGYGYGKQLENLVMPLRVNVRSPLRVDRDPGDWRTKDAAITVANSPHLKIKSAKVEDDLDSLLRDSDYGRMTYNTPEQKKLRSILQRSGYDSILYPNAVENLYRTKPGVSPRLDNLMTNIQMRRADAAQSPDYNRQDRLDRKLEQAENLYSAGIGKNDNRSWIVLDPRDIRHQSALFNIDDMGSANLWKADGGMVEHHDAERLAAMHAALDREAALRGAHRYADGGSVEASEPEGIPVPPDLVPMLHEQLGLRFADGGAVDWSRYGEVPQTATPAAPDASSVAPVAAQQAQQQQQIDQYISNAMSPPRTQDAGDNYSAPPPGKSVIGEGYNNPAFWGGLIGSIAGPLGSTIGKSLGTVAGTQRANQDLLSLGVPNQVSYRDALVGANVPFGLGDTFGIGVSPQRSFTDIVTSQLMPDQYAEYVGRAQGNAPQGVGDIPGVTSDIAPGMGPPGSPGSDSWGGDSSGSDWSGGGGGASP